MPITLDDIELPSDMNWTDEHSWCPIERSTAYSLTGNLIVYESIKKAGRPITLAAQEEFMGYVWISYDTVSALYTKAAEPGVQMLLVLDDGRDFDVVFRDEGVTATPVIHIEPHTGAVFYTCEIKLQTV